MVVATSNMSDAIRPFAIRLLRGVPVCGVVSGCRGFGAVVRRLASRLRVRFPAARGRMLTMMRLRSCRSGQHQRREKTEDQKDARDHNFSQRKTLSHDSVSVRYGYVGPSVLVAARARPGGGVRRVVGPGASIPGRSNSQQLSSRAPVKTLRNLIARLGLPGSFKVNLPS
jgi:hypothetical protein